MKQPFFVGCLVFLVIAAALLIFGGTQVYQRLKATGEEVDAIRTAIAAHDGQHPFTPPPTREIAPEQLERVLAVRAGVAAPISEFLNRLKDGGVMDKVRAGIELMPTVSRAFLEQLKAQQISSTEYLWVIDQVMAVILRGKSPDASEPHRRLYQAYQAATTVTDKNRQVRTIEHGNELLERALAADVSPTEEALILARSEPIIASMTAVLGDAVLASLVEHDRRNHPTDQSK
ncbi:MAG: hypothetical protein U1E76_08830 [Planctomycetota bacterium]